MSIALLEFSALQSIILQPFVNILHDSSEMIYEVNGNHGFLMLQTRIDTNGSFTSYSRRQIQDDTNQVATFLMFSIKSAAPPPYKKKKRTYYIPPVISLASFKEIKVSTLYIDRKKNCIFSASHSLCMVKYTSVMKISKRNVSRTYAIVLCLPVRCFFKNVFKL